MDFDILTPIDTKSGIDHLGGEPQIFYPMLELFESMSLIRCME